MMSPQQLADRVFWIAILAIITVWLFNVGCANLNCEHPEFMAAKRGTVLECSWVRKDGRKVRSCLVVKPGGRTANISYEGCPVQ